ncbi:UNKNOWN [Stylonychia lemnae]|uniref:Uncharacterized protein n=1 Tax=Stylonychia lemnae TaxID=5949 RepID=A0A078A1J8_STYLE|nr:UNKNOWN [Stylonychia lemnae]|eukprot:CDW76136.1 UNKNOWN [Stylonychia lemnae]
MLILHQGILQTQRSLFSTKRLFKIKDFIDNKGERLDQHVSQRNEMLNYIYDINSFQGLNDFMIEYKTRVSRINDRENALFMDTLLKHVNNSEFIDNLETDLERLEIIELLIENCDLFEKGSVQYHVNFKISEKYLDSIDIADQLESLTRMCIYKQQKNAHHIGTVFTQLLHKLLQKQDNLHSTLKILADSTPIILSKALNYADKRQILSQFQSNIEQVSHLLTAEQIIDVLDISMKLNDIKLSQSKVIVEMQNYINQVIKKPDNKHLQDQYLSIIVQSQQRSTSILRILEKADNDSIMRNLEGYLKIIIQSGHQKKLSNQILVDLLAAQSLSDNLNLINFFIQSQDKCQKHLVKDELDKRLETVMENTDLQIDQLISLACILNEFPQHKNEIEKVSYMIFQILDNQANDNLIEHESNNFYIHLQILANIIQKSIENKTPVSEAIQRIYSQVFMTMFKYSRQSIAFSRFKEFLQICDVYCQEIFPSMKFYRQGFDSLTYLLQNNHIKEGLTEGILHLLRNMLINIDSKEQLVQKQDMFINILMKNFKPKAAHYKITDLISLDTLLCEIYQDRRPQQFVQMLQEQLTNFSDSLSVTEKIDGLAHLAQYGLKFDSFKQPQQQKLVQLVESVFKQITGFKTDDNQLSVSLLVISTFLQRHQRLNLDQDVIKNYEKVKDYLFNQKDERCLVPFINASDVFQIDLEEDEIAFIKSMFQQKFKQLNQVQNEFTLESNLKDKVAIRHLTHSIQYLLNIKTFLEFYSNSIETPKLRTKDL